MDFFKAQDDARRSSRILVVWFMLAVIGIVAAVYLAVAVAMGFGAAAETGAPAKLWDPDLFLLTALGVGGLILLGSAFKVIALSRNGGQAIAEELGGRQISRATGDPLERRLVNVVDEMAIASGIPAPPVYVLDAEHGINAFAAGSKISEGVVAVTRGTLEKLSRDELQGVIAHEFSHILNGDMRLNLRLIGVLHGILLLTLAGRVLMRSGRGSNKNAAPILIGGLALVLVGYIGVLFGNLIKAGVSRQREYLADAAAVQFTRNPDGIAGALKKIAGIGSDIQHPRAEEASHMFFGSSAHFSRLLATHPPVQERIRRLDRSFKPETQPRRADAAMVEVNPSSEVAVSLTGSGATQAFSPTAFTESIGQLQPEHIARTHALLVGLPDEINEAAHQTTGARAVIFALLLSPDAGTAQQQRALIESHFGEEAKAETDRIAAWLRPQGPRMRLPLLDLALPTLTPLTSEARHQIADLADQLIAADGKTSVFEFVLRRLLRANLLPPRSSFASNVSLKTLKSDVATLIGALARVGASTPEQMITAYRAAIAHAPVDGPWPDPSPESRPSLKELDRILDHLAATRPAFRKRLIESAATAVSHDGRITPTEAELLRAVCQALDCPAPILRAD